MLTALLCNLNSMVLDYIARQKVGGTHLTYSYLNQFAVLLPSAYAPHDLEFIASLACELVYTAWDLQPFARDLGYDGPPYKWGPERRAALRAELDAYYASLYGLTRDELRYILDPKDVYGPDFPGETFRVLKERECREFGEYRTRRLVLEAWDRLGLEPRNRDGRYEISPASGSASPDAHTSTRRQSAPAAVVGGGSTRTVTAPNGHAPTPQSASGRTTAQHERSVAAASGEAGSAPSQVTTPEQPAHASARRQRLDLPGQAQQPELLEGAEPNEPNPDAELRARVLRRGLEVLAAAGPLSARELAQRLAHLDPRIDRTLIVSVLAQEGMTRVRYEAESGKYRLR